MQIATFQAFEINYYEAYPANKFNIFGDLRPLRKNHRTGSFVDSYSNMWDTSGENLFFLIRRFR